MIPIRSDVRVWLATGHTDMRRGMHSLALIVQQSFARDPHAGDLYIFRGRRGSLLKILWHDGVGIYRPSGVTFGPLYAKRLDHGRFIWPQTSDGVIAISPAQLGYMLEAIDWRNPQTTVRPTAAG